MIGFVSPKTELPFERVRPDVSGRWLSGPRPILIPGRSSSRRNEANPATVPPRRRNEANPASSAHRRRNEANFGRFGLATERSHGGLARRGEVCGTGGTGRRWSRRWTSLSIPDVSVDLTPRVGMGRNSVIILFSGHRISALRADLSGRRVGVGGEVAQQAGQSGRIAVRVAGIRRRPPRLVGRRQRLGGAARAGVDPRTRVGAGEGHVSKGDVSRKADRPRLFLLA